MVQTRIEERLEFIDQEIAGMKKELSKVPAIEVSLNEIAKSIDLMRLQSEKQQQLLFTIMETSSREWLAMSEVTESVAKETEKAKGKENEATSSKMAELDRNFGFDRTSKKRIPTMVFTTETSSKRLRCRCSLGRIWILGYFEPKAPLFDLPERVVEDTFMNGLLPWVRAEVVFCRPKGLAEMMEVAQMVENREIVRIEAKLSGYSGGKLTGQVNGNGKAVSGNVAGENKGNTSFPIRTITLRSSGPNENRRGGSYKRTMKVRGKLLGEDVIILIDCGATHNFVSEKLVKKLILPIKETSHYGVILGSGAAIQGKGICEKLEVQLNNWKIIEDFLPLDLGGVDVILGMQWLFSLGVTTVDWKNLSLTFSVDGKSVNIKLRLSTEEWRLTYGAFVMRNLRSG
ncbi:gypsy/ty3 element polyprotein [Cucumis melo var. makuwa]|uniref:Gypsy/ty3 element polyprotein n=1 Tax=Cucumis melo var. makuwa TaxID=1194695 RepID=A0A5D3DYC2_CUCMM|nr:gypsy/ty3 element polyprotein [Cucumis melo var. makuwa]